MGFTYINSSGAFGSPCTINTEGYDITNDLDTTVRYTCWQFVVGIDVPILGKKVNTILAKDKDTNDNKEN